MKKLYALLMLCFISASTLCGPLWSKPGKRIKISSMEALESVFKNKNNGNFSIEALKQMGMLTAFADKEFYEDDLESKVDGAFQDCWNTISKQAEAQLGKELFEQQKDRQYQQFMKGVPKVKPVILEVLREASTVIEE